MCFIIGWVHSLQDYCTRGIKGAIALAATKSKAHRLIPRHLPEALAPSLSGREERLHGRLKSPPFNHHEGG